MKKFRLKCVETGWLRKGGGGLEDWCLAEAKGFFFFPKKREGKISITTDPFLVLTWPRGEVQGSSLGGGRWRNA